MTVSRCIFYLLAPFLVLLIALSFSSNAERIKQYPSAANLSTSWLSRPSTDLSYAGVKPILVSGSFVCGFHYGFTSYNSYVTLFAVSIFSTSSDDNHSTFSPKMVWSANRNNPVDEESKLQLTHDGDLLLTDGNGSLVWSAATGGQSVLGLKLTEEGNLVLFGRNNTLAWQSFEHPTDSLVPGQRLLPGQKLISASASNWSEGLYSFALENHRLVAYMNLGHPLVYYISHEGFDFAEYKAGKFGPFTHPSASSPGFIQLGSDGHLRAYELRQSNWAAVSDLLTACIGSCGYPLACGSYGICSDGHCTCPESADSPVGYFRQMHDDSPPYLGCALYTPISCEFSRYHSFLQIYYLDYIAFELGTQINETDKENCKQACLKNCSCKAAVFGYIADMGSCFLLSEVMSFRKGSEPTVSFTAVSTFIKVQNPSNFLTAQGPQVVNVPEKKSEHAHPGLTLTLGSSLGSAFGMFLMITIFFILRNRKESEEPEDEYLDMVSEMPCRFCYEELKAITDDFSNLLGGGGFGSVFEGTLPNGTKVAVKCLNGSGQVKKSFLAEVLTMGSIHHVNLVRLRGFCAQKNHRFLVYEYMCKGSLDKWVFHRDPQVSLGWQTRKKIVHDIAKGLAYLHQECRQKIFHLDVKPQNILLDEKFNAKVSDFGLAKLIDKELSQVVTTMRGTPGYMAPEWLSSVITEKVDVYSFGVVVLEILCGRKNVDRCQPEERMHLLTLLKKKAEGGQLLDLVDKNSEDMQMNGAEVVKMMKVAVWCLQGDYAKRPSMSVVVKALEGSLPVEENLEYVFWAPPEHRALGIQGDREALVTVVLHSALSGPR